MLWPTHNRDYNYDDDDDYDVMEGGGGYVYKEVLRLWLENLFNSFYSFWCCSLSHLCDGNQVNVLELHYSYRMLTHPASHLTPTFAAWLVFKGGMMENARNF